MSNEALYGSDVQALDDLPDPEVQVAGDLNVAYAIGRRWLSGEGVMQEIGDPEPYDCIDIRDWIGGNGTAQTLADLETQATQVAEQDPRVLSIDVTASYQTGRLSLTGEGQGTGGPFRLVVSVDGLTAAFLEAG
jgi:hypothetical protein